MYEDESDAALWLEAVSGTDRAFVVLFDRYRVRVFRAAYRRTGDVGQAEEAVAIVFFEAWRLRKRVRIVDGSLLPWLLAVTTRVSFNLSRAQRRYARMIAQLPPTLEQTDHAADVDERLDNHERTEALTQAIASLSPGDRAVVELCLVEELPLAAAAAALDVPVGTVKSRLHRARRQLRTKLGGPDISIEPITASDPNEGRLS
ncbi:RNA polymerase sigma factor [Microbacterium rhizomatis]|uniref:RNA polymerase sigma factor n=1 Tax=Microbacterium rhizomatis TaxID=1631477 RepID=A0A5J5IX30_9MICO|nr:RNA polymerase sigma factor [Microbacterium rhizomatis]KAA9105850.1 RNA polymerase sigma factor [Microbacterium rhizomatis]